MLSPNITPRGGTSFCLIFRGNIKKMKILSNWYWLKQNGHTKLYIASMVTRSQSNLASKIHSQQFLYLVDSKTKLQIAIWIDYIIFILPLKFEPLRTSTQNEDTFHYLHRPCLISLDWVYSCRWDCKTEIVIIHYRGRKKPIWRELTKEVQFLLIKKSPLYL